MAILHEGILVTSKKSVVFPADTIRLELRPHPKNPYQDSVWISKATFGEHVFVAGAINENTYCQQARVRWESRR